MNVMRRLVVLSSVLCAGAISFTPGDAVGGSTAVGSNCHVYNYQLTTPPPYLTDTNVIAHGLYDPDAPLLGVTCSLPTENTLGSTVNFRARVYDGSSTTGVSCYGVVYNQDGTAIVTSSTTSTSGAGMGYSTLTRSVTVSPQSSSYTYGLVCTLPGNLSNISAVRIY
jgi:hypothetical protein